MALSGTESSCLSSTAIHQPHSHAKFISCQTPYPKPASKSKKNTGSDTAVSYSDSVSAPPLSTPQTQTSPLLSDPHTLPSSSSCNFADDFRPESPGSAEYAEDDISMWPQPSRHVDYLTHNWEEEDIWLSWKCIVSKPSAYVDSARLENASWRAWTKLREKLKTVTPESINWLKDFDINWLYGPLQKAPDKSSKVPETPPTSGNYISKSNSPLNHKSILKRRSMSETMFRRSLSTLPLAEQGVVRGHTQQCREAGRKCDCPNLERETSDCVRFSFSRLESPSGGKQKRIHFNEQVEQFVASGMTDDADEEVSSDTALQSEESDSDDGVITLKAVKSKPGVFRTPKREVTLRTSCLPIGKTFTVLPSTTLKYGEDILEPLEGTVRRSEDFWDEMELSTLTSEDMLSALNSTDIPFDNNLDDDDRDINWQSHFLTEDTSCMRCKASGILMRDGEEDEGSESVFEEVADLVNTVKDIAYLIWHTGRR